MDESVLPKQLWTLFLTESTDLQKYTEIDRQPGDLNDNILVSVPAGKSLGTCLVIDSLSQGKNVVGFLLKKLGYTCEIIDDIYVALSKIEMRSFKMIFINTDLFGFDYAHSMTKKLLELDCSTPVVGINFEPTPIDILKSDRIGLDGFINKASLTELIEIIGKHSTPDSKSRQISDVVSDTEEMPFTLLFAGGQEFSEAVALFSGSVRVLLSCLKFAIQDRDLASLNNLAESLRQTCIRMGLQSMSSAVEQLMQHGKECNWPRALDVIRLLNAQCDVAIRHMQKSAVSI